MRWVAIALAVGAGWFGVVDRARACSWADPCLNTDRFFAFVPVHDDVATDGVIAFRFERYPFAMEMDQALGYISVSVTDAMGQPVAGALEPSALDGIVVFRPDAALAASSFFDVDVLVDNDALAAAGPEDPLTAQCAANIAFVHTVDSGAGPLPPLSAPATVPSSEVEILPNLYDLTQLVCCDGAFPTQEIDACTSAPAHWTEGDCRSEAGDVLVRATFDIEPVDVPEAWADLVPVFVAEEGWTQQGEPLSGEVSAAHANPFCARVDFWSLSRQTAVSSAQSCFGEDVARQLGYDMALDPTAELARACVGEPYTCLVVSGDGDLDQAWNPDACEAWPPGAAEGGSESGGSSGGEGTEGGAEGTLTAGPDGSDADGSGGEGGSDGASAGAGVNDRGCACGGRQGRAGALALVLVVAARRRRAPPTCRA
jgi:hypothetical protein